MGKWGIASLGLLFSSFLQAQPVAVVGVIPVKISTTDNYGRAVAASKTIVLQKIQLSPDAKRLLKSRIIALEAKAGQPPSRAVAAPVRINLGMNGTPVLDQGAHGTCVTFANTGAIDAVIGKGDYVSQLCSLELGTYLVQKRLAYLSGWDGSWGTAVLGQLSKYGIFPKSYQLTYGCAGVKAYPLYTASNRGKPMSIAEYTANSKPLSYYASWVVLASANDTFSPNFNPALLLSKVKQYLVSGKRVTFGVLLDETQGSAGAVGTYKKRYDTWVLNPTIIAKAKNGTLRSGHEMIIIGYDDLAVVRNSNGTLSRGLLILRNSWGVRAGDGGNYYMSYDYFKSLCDEATAIIPKR